MARLQKSAMLERICEALLKTGWSVELLSEPKVHPAELRMERENQRFNVRVYVWNLTHGGKPRSKDELRIQVTPVNRFDRMPGGQVLILGWNDELEAFAAFDLDHHTGVLGASASLQISKPTLQTAKQFGIAARAKGNNEIVVGLRPDFLGLYVQNQARLHNPLEAQRVVDALRQAHEDVLEPHIQLAGYIRTIEQGAVAQIGTVQEIAERKVILERLAVLEKEIEEFRSRPGMMGHNRPPPDEDVAGPSISEISEAAHALGQELSLPEPKAAEVARRATILERLGSLWRAAKREAKKTAEQAREEIRKKAIGAAVTMAGGSAWVWHGKIAEVSAEVVDAVLKWLHVVLS